MAGVCGGDSCGFWGVTFYTLCAVVDKFHGHTCTPNDTSRRCFVTPFLPFTDRPLAGFPGFQGDSGTLQNGRFTRPFRYENP